MHEQAKPRPEDDDIDSRDKPCTCGVCDCAASGNTKKPKQHGADPHAKNCDVYLRRQENCAKHGIAASNARQNRYWIRVGRD